MVGVMLEFGKACEELKTMAIIRQLMLGIENHTKVIVKCFDLSHV